MQLTIRAIPSWLATLLNGWSATATARQSRREEEAAEETQALARLTAGEPDPGYVYLSVSRAMPGFVQIDRAAEDPRGLCWTLRTFSGVTRFRNVCAVRTRDCDGLIARFTDAVLQDQIPHHADLFKIRLRIAQNILETEAAALPSALPMPPADRRTAWAWVSGAACAVIAALACFGSMSAGEAQKSAQRPAQAPRAEARQAAAKPSVQPAVEPATSIEPAKVVARPQFRISKM